MVIPPQYVIAIFADGTEQILSDKRQGNTGRTSRCSFFEVYPRPPFKIHLRIDWGDKNSNNDPTLDAQVYREDGEQLDYDWWHQTPKGFRDGEWIYEFRAFGLALVFKLGFTTEVSQSGVARIVRDEALLDQEPPQQYPGWAIGEKQVFCASCQTVTRQDFAIDRNHEIVATCACGRSLKFPLTETQEQLDALLETHQQANDCRPRVIQAAASVPRAKP